MSFKDNVFLRQCIMFYEPVSERAFDWCVITNYGVKEIYKIGIEKGILKSWNSPFVIYF
jgi:hypothetical protein